MFGQTIRITFFSTLLSICFPLSSYGELAMSSYNTSCSARILLEETPDLDNNNLRDYLVVSLAINVPYEDTYMIDIKLLAKGNIPVASASMDPRDFSKSGAISGFLERGSNKLKVYFSSQAIRRISIDGPFNISILIRDHEEHTVGNFTLKTKPYSAAKFQSQLFSAGDIKIIGIDTHNLGSFDKLKVILPGYSTDIGNLVIESRVYGGSELLDSRERRVRLRKGRQALEIEHPGSIIFRSFTNGPYKVKISLREESVEKVIEGDSPSYRFVEFQPPRIINRAQTTQVELDTDDDGSPDILQVSAELAMRDTGNYQIHGILADSDLNFLASADTGFVVGDPQQVEATIDFPISQLRQQDKSKALELTLLIINERGETLGVISRTTRVATVH